MRFHYLKKTLFTLNAAFLLGMAFSARASDDCAQCIKLKEEITQFKTQLVGATQQLENERAKIKELAETSLPKKMQTTSSIFVLVARIETLQNDIKGNELDLKKLKCANCARAPKTNTSDPQKSSSSSH